MPPAVADLACEVGIIDIELTQVVQLADLLGRQCALQVQAPAPHTLNLLASERAISITADCRVTAR